MEQGCYFDSGMKLIGDSRRVLESGTNLVVKRGKKLLNVCIHMDDVQGQTRCIPIPFHGFRISSLCDSHLPKYLTTTSPRKFFSALRKVIVFKSYGEDSSQTNDSLWCMGILGISRYTISWPSNFHVLVSFPSMDVVSHCQETLDIFGNTEELVNQRRLRWNQNFKFNYSVSEIAGHERFKWKDVKDGILFGMKGFFCK